MPYTRVTLAQLIARLGDRYETSPFWTDEDATDAINGALRIVNLLTGTWKQRVQLVTVAQQAIYALPAPLAVGARVTSGAQPLEYTSFSDLRLTRPGWYREHEGSGGDVPTRTCVWCPWGRGGLVLWPAPSTVVHLTIDGVITTPVLTWGGQPLDLDEGLIGPVVDLALGLTALRPGGTTVTEQTPRVAAALGALAEQDDRLRALAVFQAVLKGANPERRYVPAARPPDSPDARPLDALQPWGGGESV